MAKDTKKSDNPAPEANGEMGPEGAAPSLRIIAQYLKDFSFENPNAPDSLPNPNSKPAIDVSVNVNAKNLNETDFEVDLQLEAKAEDDGKVSFASELVYSGIFRLENIPEDQMHPVVLIECPRMLFPFARQILADSTRHGGFPPLMLDPIDFAGLYHQRMLQEEAEGQK